MRVLSLFSGIGLHDLGLHRAGLEIAGQVEIDPWCSAVLAEHWPDVPRWEDIRFVEPVELLARCGRIDLVTGGFPCTDISTAGRGAGINGKNSRLWFEMLRIIAGVRPSWCLVENSPALRKRGVVDVVGGLEAEGYTVIPPVVVGAWSIGAPHKRARAWIVARRVGDPAQFGRRKGEGWPEGAGLTSTGRAMPRGADKARRVADADGSGLEEHGGEPRDAREERSSAVGGCGLGVADTDRDGLHRFGSGGLFDGERQTPGDDLDGRSSWPTWPAGRGAPQHEWEPPRVIEFGVGRNAPGSPDGMDGFAGGDGAEAVHRAAKKEAKFRRWCNAQRLKALGNANPPIVPELIGRWIIEQETR